MQRQGRAMDERTAGRPQAAAAPHGAGGGAPTEMQKMLAGALYRADDPQLQREAAATQAWLVRYNTAPGAPAAPERHALLRERLAAVGRSTLVRAPFYCDYGFNIHLGTGVFLNFNCTILDVAEVTIGDGTLIAPGVQILAADHPRDAATRRAGLELGRPVHIGRNVWIGAGALVLPGVCIGDDAIVGAGSVVTRSVAAGATVAGNPARCLGQRGPDVA